MTTCARNWVDSSNVQHIAMGFDQEAAAVMMSRIAVFRYVSSNIFSSLPPFIPPGTTRILLSNAFWAWSAREKGLPYKNEWEARRKF